MRRYLFLFLSFVATATFGQSSAAPRTSQAAQAPAQPASDLQKKVEAYLRHVFAWGPTFRVKFGPLKDSPISGLYEFTVDVSMGDQSDSGIFYVTKDGRFLFRGDIQDMNVDQLAAVRSQINLSNSPSKGPANAVVTLVEYADFQCPSCRELHNVLREIEPQYPQIRIVFKDFPLTQLHPWAMTAATAARCAYQQNHAAFWKLYDAIYDSQDLITPENAWQKMLDLAGQAGLNVPALKTCMSDPATGELINESLKEGLQLKIANTPTVFVNGRRLIGSDRSALEQFIQYELSLRPRSQPAAQPEKHNLP